MALRKEIAVFGALFFVFVLLFGCASAGVREQNAKPVPGGIEVSWSVPEKADIAGYNIYRSTSNGVLGDRINSVMVATTSYTDTNVRDGIVYYYIVRSVNPSGAEDGNTVQVSAEAKVRPPSNLQLMIEGGKQYVNSRSVSLQVSAIGASLCRYSNDGTVWSDWSAYATSVSWNLNEGDGQKEVFYQCKDDIGNVAGSVSSEIYLDTTPPEITILSPTQGGQYGGGFDLVFKVVDPISATVVCSGDLDGSQIALGVMDVGKEDKTSIIAKAGQHTLNLNCSDMVNSVKKSISFTVVDKPTISLHVESGAGYTATTKVTLSVASNPVSKECRFSNDMKSWSDWSAFSGSVSWTLSSGDGTKNVYGQCRNKDGEQSDIVSDSIILDSKPPPYISITINNADQWTNNRVVLLGLYAFSADQCRFANEDDIWSEWEQYITRRSWTLSQNEGTKYVSYECKDKNGNIIGSTSGTIILSSRDPNPPSNMRIRINGGDSYTGSRYVSLDLRADNADDCRFKESGGEWTSWMSYRTRSDWTLSDGNGKKTIYYMCENDFGTVSTSASIYLDMGPPGRITDLRASSSVDMISLRWSRPSDQSGGIKSYRIYRSTEEFGLFTPIATAYSTSYKDYNVVSGETYAYSVRAVDSSGNEAPDSNIVTVTAGLVLYGTDAN